ncbi:GH25131 [Drosophila grimshawi]|uniref:GH25131 n=1 Tax=Drosophila grimshawi TaxID=7222 RepID=B4JZF7_DROGR|nr:GH25131 [Drosophila grimshawi]
MDADLFEGVNAEVMNGNTITSYIIFKRNVDQFELDTSFDMLKPNNQKLRLFQNRFDGCQFLNTNHKNRLFNMFIKSLKQSSNTILRCPLKSHFNYTITKMHLNETDFPQYVPECDFQGLTKFYIRNKFVFRMFMKGRVEYKN